MTADCEYQNLFATLVHDVRQPLTTIEYSAQYLDILLRDAPESAREQVRMILRQVSRADGCLRDAAHHLRRLQQAHVAGADFELANSTSLVT